VRAAGVTAAFSIGSALADIRKLLSSDHKIQSAPRAWRLSALVLAKASGQQGPRLLFPIKTRVVKFRPDQ